jgi:polyphosphate kinase
MDNTPQERYFDRELSWIRFNARVLAEAMDPANPVLERLKFIGIVSSNFDEFFMVRVSSIPKTDPLLPEIYRQAFSLIRKQLFYFKEILASELEAAGIARVLPQALNEKQLLYVKNLFLTEFLPLLTPLAIHEEQPFPNLVNLGLYRFFELTESSDLAAKRYALVEIPKNCPRMITLPSESVHAFILIEDVIGLFAQELFRGFMIGRQGTLRVTRGAEFTIDEEKDEDLAKLMSEALRSRRESPVVRLEIDAPDDMMDRLKRKMGLEDREIFKNEGWPDLKSISQLAFQPGFERLKRSEWIPRPVLEMTEARDLWGLLKEKDVLVHYPYDSFSAFLRFISAAAEDPDVLAIKQTLYRTGHHSQVINALEKAVENGKQVTVLVELKARFDEEQNIEEAKRLERAGATVLYGVVGLKTHSKVCLIVRREAAGIKRYLHLGTGNYNEKTAQIYSDLNLFTSQDELAADVSSFFNLMTGFSSPGHYSKLEVAPYGLRRRLLRLIFRESAQTSPERPGLIIAKMNSLVDKEIIDALYRASQKGVQIKLNVRGICRLRPGVKGLSENIEVVSIVDMFLEHSRLFYFSNAGDEEVYLSSADWMPRNFDRRLELMFPVEDKKNKKELIQLLGLYFKDNTKSWVLSPNGEYKKKERGEEKKFRVQEYLCQKALENEALHDKQLTLELKPQRPKKEIS